MKLTKQQLKQIIREEISLMKESSSAEYVIWGIPPGKTEEQILYTKAESMSEANKARKVLEDTHGCKKTRVQVIDLSKTTDFGKEFAKTVR